MSCVVGSLSLVISTEVGMCTSLAYSAASSSLESVLCRMCGLAPLTLRLLKVNKTRFQLLCNTYPGGGEDVVRVYVEALFDKTIMYISSFESHMAIAFWSVWKLFTYTFA